MTAAEILRSLQRPKRDKRDIVDAIRRRAKVTQIVAALSESDNALTRQILCDVLGSRAEPEAVPALVAALDDGSEGVRAAAADSIAKIGQPLTGPTLLRHLKSESSVPVRQMLILAIGATGCEEATPDLLEALHDPSEMIRGCAAWSLGHMRIASATSALEEALDREPEEFAQTRMKAALAEMTSEGRSE